MEERPDDGTHHVAQEAVGRDREDPLTRLRPWAPVSLGDTAVIRLDVGMELAEAREVREVQELGSSYIHALEVQREVQA